jgi:hypothetical protein
VYDVLTAELPSARFTLLDKLDLPPGGVLDGTGLDEAKAGAVLDGDDAAGVAANERAEFRAHGAVGSGIGGDLGNHLAQLGG